MQVTEELVAQADPSLALGRYRLGQRIGAGGFGTVYEARDERLGRSVAVKAIPSDGRADERAKREAHAVARLDHPGIVSVFDAGEEDGSRFLVSELVRGATLAQLEAAGAVSDRDVLRIGLALADALAHAHERGVIHRDVKPQNVMVPERPRSPYGAAKLTDFGVAHLAGDEPLTRTGDVVGTLAYMAPEQAAGERIDERCDLYALGLVLYEALAGVNPVRAGSPAATLRRVGVIQPPLASKRKDLPPELCAALDRTLLPSPDDRGDLVDLADALAEALPVVSDDGGTVAPHPLEDAYELPSWTARAAAAAGAGLLVALAVGGLLPHSSLPAAAAAAGAAILVALVPSAGWILAAAATLMAMTFGEDTRVGAALVIFLAVAMPPLLVRGAAVAWSAPALAPLLGHRRPRRRLPGPGRHRAQPLDARRDRRLRRLVAAARRAAAGPQPAARPGRPARAAALRRRRQHRRQRGHPADRHVRRAVAARCCGRPPPSSCRGSSAAARWPADIVGATVWSAGLAAATASLGVAVTGAQPHGLVAGSARRGHHRRGLEMGARHDRGT